MDNLPQQPVQSPVQTPPPSGMSPSESNLPKNILKVVGALLILVSILLILNYFGIIPLSRFIPFLNLLPTQSIKPQATAPQTPQKLTFSCPVDGQFCNLGKPILYKLNKALSYDLPTGSTVKPVIDASESQEFLGPGIKSVKQTLEFQDHCYIISYTFADDASIEPVPTQPPAKNAPVAKVGSKKITLDNQTANLIIQMQKISLSEINSEEGFPKCSSFNPGLRSKDFGPYVDLQNIP